MWKEIFPLLLPSALPHPIPLGCDIENGKNKKNIEVYPHTRGRDTDTFLDRTPVSSDSRRVEKLSLSSRKGGRIGAEHIAKTEKTSEGCIYDNRESSKDPRRIEEARPVKPEALEALRRPPRLGLHCPERAQEAIGRGEGGTAGGEQWMKSS